MEQVLFLHRDFRGIALPQLRFGDRKKGGAGSPYGNGGKRPRRGGMSILIIVTIAVIGLFAFNNFTNPGVRNDTGSRTNAMDETRLAATWHGFSLPILVGGADAYARLFPETLGGGTYGVAGATVYPEFSDYVELYRNLDERRDTELSPDQVRFLRDMDSPDTSGLFGSAVRRAANKGDVKMDYRVYTYDRWKP